MQPLKLLCFTVTAAVPIAACVWPALQTSTACLLQLCICLAVMVSVLMILSDRSCVVWDNMVSITFSNWEVLDDVGRQPNSMNPLSLPFPADY